MKIFFFTGKGGVGKSTLAAASAWQLSQKHRVLIVSLDPAHNLGDIFGVAVGSELRFSDSLYLREVDLKKQTKAYLKKEIQTFTDSYKYLQALNLDTYFSVLKYSPGIEEYALLTSIRETMQNGSGFDYIIFDTPPTGLTLRFLALPQVTVTWIDRLIQIRQKILQKFHTIRRIKGAQSTEETLLSYTEGDDDILQKLFALKSEYLALSRTLQGAECSIVLVFNPDLLSLRESLRLIEGLEELHLPLRLLFHNKLSPGNEEIAGQVEAEISKATAATLKHIRLRPEFQKGTAGRLYNLEEDLAPLFEGH